MKKEYLYGILAVIGLSLVYFLTVSLIMGFKYSVNEFISLWYVMVPLILGFGLQVSLYSHMKRKVMDKKCAMGVTASGGVSSGSMVACCAHHVTDVLPVLGVTGITLFLSKYQLVFLIVGILSNLIGINFMLYTMKKHNLYEGNFLNKIMKYDLKFILKINVLLSFIILLVSVNYIGGII